MNAFKSEYQVSIYKKKYWGEYAQDVMNKLILQCKTMGWESALKEFFSKEDPEYYDYILDEGRANWHFLIPLKEDARILDLGCGWGTLSFALSKIYKEVIAFDVVTERLEFIEIRRRSQNLQNILSVCGQINYLPFPDNYFDLVILNGVLEWIPYIEEDKDPYPAQIEALREARRVLKKDGYLYLAIENRWSVINFLGFKDTHSGLRFAPLLPRYLANIYSRLMRKKDFREYTYTYWQHRKILKKVGFSQIKFYTPIPSYRRFYYLIPVDEHYQMKFFT
jgi:ubiquinone/menaquinone biosynthesis C-methylase UbiE